MRLDSQRRVSLDVELRHRPFGRDYGVTGPKSPQNTYMRVLRPCEHGPSRDGPKGVNARLDCNSKARPERVFVDNENVSPSKGSRLVTSIRRAYPGECFLDRLHSMEIQRERYNSIFYLYLRMLLDRYTN